MRDSARLASRAQSTVLGAVLVLGVIFGGSMLIITLGSEQLNNAESQIRSETAVNHLSQFASQTRLVAVGDSRRQTLEASRTSGVEYNVRPDRGWIRVTATNVSANNDDDDDDEANTVVLTNTTLGAVEYEGADETVAFQGGGVWRRGNSGGSVMESPPTLQYRGDTLTMPIVAVGGEPDQGRQLEIAAEQERVQLHPNESDDRSNPLDDHRVTITVKSEYYQAWGDFFNSRTAGAAEVDHDTNTVSVTLVVEDDQPTVDSGVINSASDSEFDIGSNVNVDSYNSSEGPYNATRSTNGSISTAGTIKLGSSSTISGDINTGGDVVVESSSAEVNGNISYGGQFDDEDGGENADISGWVAPNGSSPEVPSFGTEIQAADGRFRDNNDNASAAGTINDLEQGNSCGTCELTAGQYHMDAFKPQPNDEVTLNTSDGDITIYVDGDMYINQGDGNDLTQVQVEGPGRVNVYLNGDLTVESQTEISVPGDRSTQFWIYMDEDASATINQARVTGVIYGPGSGDESGVDFNSDSDDGNPGDLYGAVVGDVADSDNNFDIHYDEALQQTTVAPREEALPEITYLYVSRSDVEVSAD